MCAEVYKLSKYLLCNLIHPFFLLYDDVFIIYACNAGNVRTFTERATLNYSFAEGVWCRTEAAWVAR